MSDPAVTNPYVATDAELPKHDGLIKGAIFALVVLFSMNLLNYVDRYVLAAVSNSIMEDLQIRPGPFGWLASSFIIVYTIVSPLVGWLGDRYSRRMILAFGVGLWSVATVGTAFAANFNQMFIARALLGVGEASYGVVAPTLLADLFVPRLRGRVMGLFYLALPVGTAIGYATGGLMEKLATEHAGVIRDWMAGHGLGSLAPYFVGWRSAFWVVGVPGIVLALCGLIIHDPGRGASERRASKGHAGEGRPDKAEPAGKPGLGEYLEVLRTPSYLFNTAGMAAVTFTIGAYGYWMPAYFFYVHGTQSTFKIVIGLALAGAGILGVLLGMWLPDRLQQSTRRAYLLWPAFAVLTAIPFGVVGLLAPNTWASLGLLFVASILLTSCLGPCNTVTANVVAANRRAVGYALSIFLLHLFGDIPSPPMIGTLSSEFARPEWRQSPVVRLLEGLGAKPIDLSARGAEAHKAVGEAASEALGTANLTAGMLVIIPILLLGSLCFFLGSRTLPRDQDRARASGGDDPEGAVPLH
jgi:MFS family permease